MIKLKFLLKNRNREQWSISVDIEAVEHSNNQVKFKLEYISREKKKVYSLVLENYEMQRHQILSTAGGNHENLKQSTLYFLRSIHFFKFSPEEQRLFEGCGVFLPNATDERDCIGILTRSIESENSLVFQEDAHFAFSTAIGSYTKFDDLVPNHEDEEIEKTPYRFDLLLGGGVFAGGFAMGCWPLYLLIASGSSLTGVPAALGLCALALMALGVVILMPRIESIARNWMFASEVEDTGNRFFSCCGL